jgi:hypothetical protein
MGGVEKGTCITQKAINRKNEPGGLFGMIQKSGQVTIQMLSDIASVQWKIWR